MSAKKAILIWVGCSLLWEVFVSFMVLNRDEMLNANDVKFSADTLRSVIDADHAAKAVAVDRSLAVAMKQERDNAALRRASAPVFIASEKPTQVSKTGMSDIEETAALVASRTQDVTNSLNRSMAIASKVSPEEFARYREMGKQTGIDPFAMAENREIAAEAYRRVREANAASAEKAKAAKSVIEQRVAAAQDDGKEGSDIDARQFLRLFSAYTLPPIALLLFGWGSPIAYRKGKAFLKGFRVAPRGASSAEVNNMQRIVLAVTAILILSVQLYGTYIEDIHRLSWILAIGVMGVLIFLVLHGVMRVPTDEATESTTGESN